MYTLLTMSATANTILSGLMGVTIGFILGAWWFSAKTEDREESENERRSIISYIDERGNIHYEKPLKKVK